MKITFFNSVPFKFQSVSFGFHLLVVKKVKVETACIQLQW